VTTRYRIKVDHDSCIGSGMCVGLAPDYFELDDENYQSLPIHKIVDVDKVCAEDVTTVLEAAECCPAEAIIITDDDTDEQLRPEL